MNKTVPQAIKRPVNVEKNFFRIKYPNRDNRGIESIIMRQRQYGFIERKFLDNCIISLYKFQAALFYKLIARADTPAIITMATSELKPLLEYIQNGASVGAIMGIFLWREMKRAERYEKLLFRHLLRLSLIPSRLVSA